MKTLKPIMQEFQITKPSRKGFKEQPVSREAMAIFKAASKCSAKQSMLKNMRVDIEDDPDTGEVVFVIRSKKSGKKYRLAESN